ncbi:MAG: Coenzyme PQQ synthesis protein E [Anaerolineae bacterium]|nr:MAG: Coenzyme PQQ synthesis protein E [Anaerolineae bacterium]
MKTRLLTLFDIFKAPKSIRPGVYLYQSAPDAPVPQKMFLRVEPNGSSSLVVNASLILHLNPVATEFAYAFINQVDEDTMIRNVMKKYRIDEETLRHDFASFLDKLEAVTKTEDLDPFEFFGIERATEQDLENLSAPFRLDCALTYRLPEDTSIVYAPVERVKKELSTDEWKSILDKSWRAGIPHIIFTGGEPTLRSDLLDLILHAEQNGQVCGLITDGHVFRNPNTVNDFLNAGLDHLMILLDAQSEESWQLIEKITPMDIFTTVHLTIYGENASYLTQSIARLASIGVNALSLSASSPDFVSHINQASELAAYHGIKLVWDLPVPYSKFNPVRLEVIDEELWEGSGKTWLYVEPDGDVLPGQGIPFLLGNLVSLEWEEIWTNCQDYGKNKAHLGVA